MPIGETTGENMISKIIDFGMENVENARNSSMMFMVHGYGYVQCMQLFL